MTLELAPRAALISRNWCNLASTGRLSNNWDICDILEKLVVRPVLKMKTGFRGFDTEQNLGFRKCAEIW